MSANRVVIDAPGKTVRGPWEEQLSGRSSVPAAVPQTDPRLELSENALVLASANAFPVVAGRTRRRDGLGLAAGGAVALILGCATFLSLNSSRHAPTTSRTGVAVSGQPRAALPMPAAVPGKPVAAPPAAMPVGAQPATMPGTASAPAHVMMPGMPPASSPVLVFDGSSAPVSVAPAQTASRGFEGNPSMLSVGNPGGSIISDNSSAHSTKLAEPASTVVQGTLIPAVLETAIDTDVPGFVRAVVSQDVRSFDGSRVLIPRSSRLIGEYKGVTQAGQRRAYLMWTRLVRPDGVSIALASPAADFSGQAGVGGQVNSHFFSRFGSAILLSILGGAGNLVTGGASSVVVSGGQSAASVAAQHDGNRVPTIKVRQGEPIRVFTARDLIFSDSGASG